MTLSRRLLFVLKVFAWSVPPALITIVLMFVGALTSYSGGWLGKRWTI